jgi:hypothetical protein
VRLRKRVRRIRETRKTSEGRQEILKHSPTPHQGVLD